MHRTESDYSNNECAQPGVAPDSSDAISASAPAFPLLRVNVFGGFEMLLDGMPVSASYIRQRRIKTLMGILALHHGQELYCDYIADSIWPESSEDKQRHCFYNLWYLLGRCTYEGRRADNPYLEREQYSCRLVDTYVETDVAEAERACDDLTRRDLTPPMAVDAYQRLQKSYRGDLLPGEGQNAIIVRAREEWRERVCEALFLAAQTMTHQGEERTALWLVKAACRIDEMREDLVRLRMRLLIKLGRPSAALRVYNEMRDYLMQEVGMGPSRQSTELVRQVMLAKPAEFSMPVPGNQKRRRGAQNRKAPSRNSQALPQQVDLPR